MMNLLWGIFIAIRGRGSAFLRFRQLIDRNINQIPADEILCAGIQRVAEFQLAALLAQRMLNDIGGYAKAYRAVAGLIMAEMSGAFSMISWLDCLP